ncbi:RecX family transcriptional regulator [Candidatus Berkiella aquae]|uniref:Regulatory protein RecX n=1 Tax=Candidatus Berkiella aquae TaxID=295108 RepID=A0A0Q9YIM8_9GAMM|nr:regulatory protein RecX [Candidatus Berkiella aquae]MCS5712244.1 recombination regulator RecX [Candidatus Berkiella aquae]
MQTIKDKAIYLLSRREHSRYELQRKLQQRGFQSKDIRPVLDELEKENLLSEERFVSSYIRSRRSRGFGPLKICAELKERGIDRDRWQSNEEWQEELWQNSAILSCAKRFGLAVAKTREQRIAQSQYLQRRGFTSSQIKMAIGAQKDNIEN